MRAGTPTLRQRLDQFRRLSGKEDKKSNCKICPIVHSNANIRCQKRALSVYCGLAVHFFHSRCKDTVGTKPFPRTSVRFLSVFCIVYFPLQRYNFNYLRIGLRRVTTGFAGTNADKSAFVPYSSINCQMVDCQTAMLSSPCIILVSSPYHPCITPASSRSTMGHPWALYGGLCFDKE